MSNRNVFQRKCWSIEKNKAIINVNYFFICSTLFGYFVKFVYNGKAKRAKKAFAKVDRAERKAMKGEYRKSMNKYMAQLETYLSTLTKEVNTPNPCLNACV